MNLLASIWEMSRCRLVEAREHDLPVVATILAENRAVFPLLGAERDPERLVCCATTSCRRMVIQHTKRAF